MAKQIIKTPTNGGRKTLENRKSITDELEKLVIDGTILGVTNSQLADKFNVRRQTIASYLKEIYKKIPAEDIKETEVKLKAMFDKIFRFSQQLLSQAETLFEKERAIRLLMSAMKEYTDFLERFGMKPKVADKIDIEQRSINLSINIDSDSVGLIQELEYRRK